jgi:hypothetical protein
MTQIPRALLALAAMLSGMPLAAQEPRPERPYRGVFGRVGQTEQLLVATGEIGGGYDSDVFTSGDGASAALQPRAGIGSSYGAVSGGLSYSLTRPRVSFAASGSSAANVYFRLTDPLVASHAGSVGASFELSRGTRVSGSQSISYQPLDSLGLYPELADPVLGQTPPVDASFGAIWESYFHYASDLSLSQALSSKAGVSVSYRRSLSDFASDDLDMVTHGVMGRFTRNVGRGLDLRLGYGYESGGYETDGLDGQEATPYGHTIEAGVDFNRELSFSRRATLSFGTGSSAVKDAGQTRYYVTGNARLMREVGRTWNATISYDRDVDFVETLREPVFSDSVNFGMGGLIGRRVDFQSNAGFAFGEVGVEEADDFRSFYASSGLLFALNRHSALGIDYYLNRYSFTDTQVLLPGVPPRLIRHSIRASISLWAPLLVRGRRNATR